MTSEASFADWVGRRETRSDRIVPAPLTRLAATLDHEAPPWAPGELPPLGHWLFHLPDARQSELGRDGHPAKGGFLPPIAQPRRMWAGSRIRFLAPVRIGALADRRTTIDRIAAKPGSDGEMLFVTLRHEIIAHDAVAVVEEQDLVYLGEPKPGGAARAPKPVPVPEAQQVRTVMPTPELLFRFSALTFNAHRIHYDERYARDVEHHPGLVVHGPLIATLLMDHFLRARPDVQVTAFDFRARSPLFAGAPFDLCLAEDQGSAELWARNADGQVAMTAHVEAKPDPEAA